VLVRGVVGDEVDQHPQSERVGVGDEPLRVGQRAEGRVDAAVVGHVVARVDLGRRVERVEPDGVDAEVAQVGQARADAGQVPDAVTIAVGEAADVDLVGDGLAPPLGGAGPGCR
jgi:hypothetical protein